MIPDKSFYVNPKEINGKTFTLNSIESNHLVNVLRLNIGDKIFLLDGLGTAYVAIIEQLSKNSVAGLINPQRPRRNLALASLHSFFRTLNLS